MRLLAMLVATAPLAVAGCGPHLESSLYPTAAPLGMAPVSPTLVLEGAPSPGPLQEIGILQAQCAGRRCTMPIVMQRLRDDAQRIGATHVVHVRIDQGATMLVAHGVAAVRVSGH